MKDKTEYPPAAGNTESISAMDEVLDGRTEKLSIQAVKYTSGSNLTEKPPGKYTEHGKIAQGGMKKILQVKDRDTARELAMAVLPSRKDDDNDIEARFIYEARITANLEHPNIVPIHDIGVDADGSPYFTMKLIEGESLAHILMKIGRNENGYADKYTLRYLLSIFIKVCNAVDFAHSKGIIHLDLKPENIQIGNYGEVLVLDWGLAKIISNPETDESLTPKTDEAIAELSASEHYEKTLDGEIKGTPGFMAPEQAAGENSKRGPATDIYALGTILYAILTLRKPIKTKDIQQALNDTVAGNIIPIHERNPARQIPKPLAAVTMKAMQLTPADRYSSVQELIKDVDAFLGGYITKAEEAGFLRHFEMLVRRNKLTTAFVTLFLLALLAFFLMISIYHTKRSSSWGKPLQITPETAGDFKKNWTPVEGNWKFDGLHIIADGKKNGAFIIFYNKPLYGNIAVEFDAEIPDTENLKPSGDLSVIIAGSKKSPDSTGYYFQVGGISNTSAVIQKRGGFMSAVTFPVKAGRKYKIRAEKEGAWLRLFCDGKLLLAYRDIFYLEGGNIGLYTFGRGKIFSNISICTKKVPELVPATVEGDAFYRESRAASDQAEQKKFLELAEKAYSKVYSSHPDSDLGLDALLKHAFVCSELADKDSIASAIHDVVILKKIRPSFDVMLLEGRLYFFLENYAKAYSTYNAAVKQYPESAIAVTSLLSGMLSEEKSKKICPELRQRFWHLCAEHDPSPVFRCTSRNLNSLEFLKGLQFTVLDCSGNNISSLKPLRGMNLKQLDCADNKISSLAPLMGMHLTALEIHNNPNLTNISCIAEMPLKTLTLSGCSALKDISVLKQCTTLEKLTIPEHLVDIELLKKFPNLKYLNTEWDNWTTTSEEFFRNRKRTKP